MDSAALLDAFEHVHEAGINEDAILGGKEMKTFFFDADTSTLHLARVNFMRFEERLVEPALLAPDDVAIDCERDAAKQLAEREVNYMRFHISDNKGNSHRKWASMRGATRREMFDSLLVLRISRQDFAEKLRISCGGGGSARN